MSLVFRARILIAGSLNSGYFNILPFAVVKSDLETVRHYVYPEKMRFLGLLWSRSVAVKFDSLGNQVRGGEKGSFGVFVFVFVFTSLTVQKVDEYSNRSVIISKSLQAYRRGFVRKDSVWFCRN